ncbi:MAG: ComEC/Rec2 family competence protein [Candidatus Dadabacteria bacterium]|nr:ComEC/Rec2 family competence protein [Candidatus Dadabacteria bacterium]
MSLFLYKYRILPVALGFILGILITEYSGWRWAAVILLCPVLGALILYRPNLSFLLFIPIGIVVGTKPPLPDNHIRNYVDGRINIEGVLYSSPQSRVVGSRLFIDVDRVFVEGIERQVSGKVVVATTESIKGLVRGDRVRVINPRLRRVGSYKNPGGVDIKTRMERRGIYVRGYVEGAESIIFFGKSRSYSSALHVIDGLRLGFADFIRKNTSMPGNELLAAITVGDKWGIPPEVRERFSRVGVAHLLAISGLHLAAIGFSFYFLVKWLMKRSEYLLLKFLVPRLAAALTIAPLVFYLLVAGFATPVTRAFIMAVIFLIAVIAGKQSSRINILSLSALVILLLHPEALFEISFQLSFISVLGIILIHKLTPFKTATFKGKVISSAKTTVGAGFMTLPIIINTFGLIPVLSIPANLVFIPLVGFFIVPMGMLSFLVFLLSDSLSLPLIKITMAGVNILMWGVEGISGLSLSAFTLPRLSALSWALYGLSVVNFILIGFNRRFRYTLPVTLACFFTFLFWSPFGGGGNSNLRVHFLDAGQRNMLVAELPGGRSLALDGGRSRRGDSGYIERAVLTPFLLNLGLTKIDYLFMSSVGEGHREGMKYLLKKIKLDVMFTPGQKLDGALWEMIRSGRFRHIDMRTQMEPLEIGGVRVEVFQLNGMGESRTRGDSYPIALKLSFKKVAVLFTDVGAKDAPILREFARSYPDRLKSRVVYVPGLIENEEYYQEFLRAVSPEIVVTNVAGGKRQSPKKIVLEGTTKPLRVLETSRSGSITVETDGTRLWLRTFVDETEDII